MNFIVIGLDHDFHENLKKIFDLLGLSGILGLSDYCLALTVGPLLRNTLTAS